MGQILPTVLTSPQITEEINEETYTVTSSNVSEDARQYFTVYESIEKIPYEPMDVITKQNYDEYFHVIKGKDEGRPVWHVILVPYEKMEVLTKRRANKSLIDVEDFGRNIKYLDETGVIRQASGYGTEPPEHLMTWIKAKYDICTIDESTPLQYSSDDIRLCTIKMTYPNQSLGIKTYYHRHENFHYVKFDDNYQSTLAFCAGIKLFDRVIELNGLNIEYASAENLKQRIENFDGQVIQLLVCSPATYVYYKQNRRRLHSNLETVIRCRPVQDSSNVQHHLVSGDLNFCAIRWIDNCSIDALPLSSINKSHQDVQLYEFCIVRNNTSQRQGIIIFIGLQEDCELLQQDPMVQSVTVIYDQFMYDNIDCNTLHEVDDGDAFFTLPQQSAENQSEQEESKIQKPFNPLLMNDENPIQENDNKAQRLKCSSCASLHINHDRYRCLQCINYDICGRCFDLRCETSTHHNAHIMVYFSNPDEIFDEPIVDINAITLNSFKEKYATQVHLGIECNNCHLAPIIGLRCKCDVCFSFNLCLSCMENRMHDQTHPFLAIGKSCFLEIPLNDIERHTEIGRGGFGTVYKGRWLSRNREIACKVIRVLPGHEQRESSFKKELTAYAELSGPYILKTYGYNTCELPTGIRECTLIMEYMSRGSLSSVLAQKEKIPLRRKVEMANQVASAIRKLHTHSMIHRDIRPDNILIAQDYTAKIGDMGIARVWSSNEYMTLAGCPSYMPPEFYSGKYDQSLDVFTFGLTLNQLFTEQTHHYNRVNRRIRLTAHSPIFPLLISRCIDDDPSKRPSAIEIETTLRLYKQAFERYAIIKNMNYTNMSVQDKDITFIAAYESLYSDIDKILQTKFRREQLILDTRSINDTNQS